MGLTDDVAFSLEAFQTAAVAYTTAKQAHDDAFAAFTAAQDAEREAMQVLERAKSELEEAQADLITDLVASAPTPAEGS